MKNKPAPSSEAHLVFAPAATESSATRLRTYFGDEILVRLSVPECHIKEESKATLEQGEETALREALARLPHDPRPHKPELEWSLPLRDVRIMRGMAKVNSTSGQINEDHLACCKTKAMEAASDMPKRGSPILWEFPVIKVDGKQVKESHIEFPIAASSIYVEVL